MSIILDRDAVNGLARIYGPIGKVIWVYKDDGGDIQLEALPEGEEPYWRHVDYRDHTLVGQLDFESGKIIEDEQFPSPLLPNSGFNIWVALEWFVKIVLALGAAGAVFVFAVASAVGGSRSRR